MNEPKVAGTKRNHDVVIAAEHQPHQTNELVASSMTESSEPARKKTKFTHEASQRVTKLDPVDLEILPAPIAPVRAKDVANNPFAPIDPSALKNYLTEVDNLELYPSRTPVQSTTSQVDVRVRQAIYERLFCGKTNSECNVAYSAGRPQQKTSAAVSKAILAHAIVWFAEEGAVLPWNGRKEIDRKRLMGLGMTAKNFPSPYEINSTISETAKKRPNTTLENYRVEAKQPDQQASSASVTVSHIISNRAGSGLKANSLEPKHFAPSDSCDDHQYAPYTHFEFCLPRLEEDETVFSRKEQNTREDEDREYEHEPTNRRNCNEETFDREYELPVREMVRAALNVFNEDLYTIKIGESSVTASKTAFDNYCGIGSTGLRVESDGCGFSPKILRAFVNTISPFPSRYLPKYDFEFLAKDCTRCVYGDDILGIVKGENVEIEDLVWDLEACFELRKLCIVMQCDLVLDMITDQVRRLYLEQCLSDTEQIFHLPFDMVAELDVAQDEPFLRLLVDIMLQERVKLTSDQLSCIDQMVAQRADSGGAIKYSTLCQSSGGIYKTAHCDDYHLHSENQKCHRDWERKEATSHLLHRLFGQLLRIVAEDNRCASAKISRERPEDLQAAGQLQLLRLTVRQSLEIEERAARTLLELEKYQKHEATHIGDRQSLNSKQHRRLMKLRWRLDRCRSNHHEVWEEFHDSV